MGPNDRKKLEEYSNPDVVKEGVGDLSLVVEKIVAERYPKTPSKITVKQMNNLLDELVDIKDGKYSGPRNHEWRTQMEESQNPLSAAEKKGEKETKAQLRADWVSRLCEIPLSPLEHKWIVRILLQKIEIGFGKVQIMGYISPYAKDLYSANNSLKRVCQTISDAEWVRRREERDAREALERQQTKWYDDVIYWCCVLVMFMIIQF